MNCATNENRALLLLEEFHARILPLFKRNEEGPSQLPMEQVEMEEVIEHILYGMTDNPPRIRAFFTSEVCPVAFTKEVREDH